MLQLFVLAGAGGDGGEGGQWGGGDRGRWLSGFMVTVIDCQWWACDGGGVVVVTVKVIIMATYVS